MSAVRHPRHRWRGWLLHLVRVGLFAAIIWLIHSAHRERSSTSPRANVTDIPAEVIVRLYGDGARISSNEGQVVDSGGTGIGRVLQTSPASDDVIGFSGPTNVLLALDPRERIVGVRILSSKDTREHVQQVQQDARFLPSMHGISVDELTSRTDWDGVSGATLTSLAIVEGLRQRLGGGLGSLKFPHDPTLEQARELFPHVARIQSDAADPSWWELYDEHDASIGGLLRTSPAADNIVGYQGPTEAFVGFDAQNRIVGLTIGASFDNEPYVGYVREDEWYRHSFDGQKLWELGHLDLEAAGVEGVSGATMTSLAVAEGMARAAARRNNVLTASLVPERSHTPTLTPRNMGTIAVLVAGLVIGLTSLRGRRWVRVPFQLLLIVYLGFINGDLVSQALLVGWAQHGVPWQSMLGVFVLSVAAFLVPMTTKHNVYCHQLCPHGAFQQWLRPSASRQVHLPRWLDWGLSGVPGVLLLLVVAVAMGAVPLSLVDIEPFDAYLLTIAGAATITIAIVGLVAAAFVPMAYCRYGCPSGAAIEFVRRHARSDRVSVRDGVAAACLLLAWWLY